MEKNIVILVHGTFSPDAPWARPESPFRQKLTKLLGEGAELRRFRWSGDNAHRARLEAGRELAEFIDAIAEENPKATFSIVAHSHGGNVACYALDDLRLSGRVLTVVAVATPFLSRRGRRSIAYEFELQILYDVFAFVAALSAALGHYLYLSDGSMPGPFEASTIWLFLGLWVFLLGVGVDFPQRFLSWMESRKQQLASQIPGAALDSTTMLAIGIKGDEASRLLTALQWLANIPYAFFRHLYGVWTKFGQPTHWSSEGDAFMHSPSMLSRLVGGVAKAFFHGFAIMILVALIGFQGMLLSNPDRIGDFIRGDREDIFALLWMINALFLLLVMLVADAIILLFLVLHLLQAIMFVLPAFLRGHRLGFGGETMLDNFLTNTRAAADPTGHLFRENVTGFFWLLPTTVLDPDAKGLLHSSLFNSRTTTVGIAAWLLNAIYRDRRIKENEADRKILDPIRIPGTGLVMVWEGGIYAGGTRSGAPHGLGTLCRADGFRCSGSWSYGSLRGDGLIRYASGAFYEGGFVAGRMSGEGRLVYADGTEFSGTFRHDSPERTGVLTWNNGNRYEGTMQGDKLGGSGVMRYADGKRVTGTWRDGKLDGPGSIHHADGREEHGMWVAGQFLAQEWRNV